MQPCSIYIIFINIHTHYYEVTHTHIFLLARWNKLTNKHKESLGKIILWNILELSDKCGILSFRIPIRTLLISWTSYAATSRRSLREWSSEASCLTRRSMAAGWIRWPYFTYYFRIYTLRRKPYGYAIMGIVWIIMPLFFDTHYPNSLD